METPASIGKWRNRVQGLRWVKASEIEPHPDNWRRHPKAQEDALRGVFDEVGFSGALLAYETSEGKLRLIDGHLRQGMAKSAELPVLVLDLDEGEARKLLATFDPLGAMAGADMDTLLDLLRDVQTEDVAVKSMLEALANGEWERLVPLTGSALASELDEGPEPQIDRADELRAQWGVESGQIWEIGRHRIMCGDSEKDSFLLLTNLHPDVLLTDPPYGINIVHGVSATIGGAKPFGRERQPGGRPRGVIGGKGIVQPRLYHPIYGDDKPFDPAWLLGLAPTIILFGANHYASRLPDSAGWLVWDKGVSLEATFSACELIWTNKGNHIKRYECLWSGMVREGSRNKELKDRIHPSQKPVGLLEQIISDYSESGQLIFDPYLGSGSTMVAAEYKGRSCYGIEYEAAYVAVTLQRMADMGLQPRRIS